MGEGEDFVVVALGGGNGADDLDIVEALGGGVGGDVVTLDDVGAGVSRAKCELR